MGAALRGKTKTQTYTTHTMDKTARAAFEDTCENVLLIIFMTIGFSYLSFIIGYTFYHAFLNR